MKPQICSQRLCDEAEGCVCGLQRTTVIFAEYCPQLKYVLYFNYNRAAVVFFIRLRNHADKLSQINAVRFNNQKDFCLNFYLNQINKTGGKN